MFQNTDTLDLTPEVFISFAKELVLLLKATHQNASDADESSQRIPYVIEYKFIALKLQNEEDPIEDIDAIHTFMEQVHAHAVRSNVEGWKEALPYLAFVDTKNPRFL
ncbi:hypothetical protein [Vibrio owensii]|uniref:hypothetical protein n=1 Tax=Vibrio owensii TaxID=696485 RepID=UPI0018F14916|nr:hypothetical protein [Vibrio owensii]